MQLPFLQKSLLSTADIFTTPRERETEDEIGRVTQKTAPSLPPPTYVWKKEKQSINSTSRAYHSHSRLTYARPSRRSSCPPGCRRAGEPSRRRSCSPRLSGTSRPDNRASFIYTRLDRIGSDQGGTKALDRKRQGARARGGGGRDQQDILGSFKRKEKRPIRAGRNAAGLECLLHKKNKLHGLL